MLHINNITERINYVNYKNSPFSGNTNSMEIEVTQEQLSSWESGVLIQNAMPNLSADEREFHHDRHNA